MACRSPRSVYCWRSCRLRPRPERTGCRSNIGIFRTPATRPLTHAPAARSHRSVPQCRKAVYRPHICSLPGAGRWSPTSDRYGPATTIWSFRQWRPAEGQSHCEYSPCKVALLHQGCRNCGLIRSDTFARVKFIVGNKEEELLLRMGIYPPP